MFDFVGVLVLLVLIALFVFLFLRSWGSKRAWLKWLGAVLSGLPALLFTLVLIVALIGYYKLNAAPGNPVSNLKAQATPEQLARAERWAGLCAGCHSTASKPPLDGSAHDFGEDPSGGPSFGTLYPPNLTPAGTIKDWSDGEVIRAIREGVHKSGRPLIIMPSVSFHSISDADIQALVAYLRSQPAVQHPTPPTNLSLFGAILVGIGAPIQMNQSPITQPVVAPPTGVNPAYGQYLVTIFSCQSCHGKDLAGGTPGGFEPAGPNLTTTVPKYSEADFIKVFRTGTTPAGKTLSEEMPWQDYNRALTDDELKAMFAHLKTLAPIIKPAQ